MSIQYDKAMRRIKEIDKLACDANSLWRSLETLKYSIAREHRIIDVQLKKESVFVEEPASDLLFADAITLAKGCSDYGGGHMTAATRNAFQHGIQTVVNVLEGVAAKGGLDSQSSAVMRVGAEIEAGEVAS